MKKVSLSKEIEALDLYLSIEKVRFGERLRLSFDIEEAAQAARTLSYELLVRVGARVRRVFVG